MQLDTLRYAFCNIHNNAKSEQDIKLHVDEAVMMTAGLLRNEETSPFIVTLSKRELFDTKPEQDDTLDSFLRHGFLFCANCCGVSGADEDEEPDYMGANENIFGAENEKINDDAFLFNPQVISQLKKYIENGGDVKALVSA